MNKQKFEKLDKVKELLDELKMTEFIAPLLVGDQIMEIINDLHNNPGQWYFCHRQTKNISLQCEFVEKKI
ncbi:TPA: hypothetical protein ACJSTX_001230 [Streptococcus agalactiae]